MNFKVNSPGDALNLSNLLKDGNWMVLYYAEWCSHCKTMKPEWKKAVNNVCNDKQNNKRNNNKAIINVAEIESSHIGNLINPPKVDGYPTIKMYNNGKEVAKFEDDRVADKIANFAISNSKMQNKVDNKVDNKLHNKIQNINNLMKSNEVHVEQPTTQPTIQPSDNILKNTDRIVVGPIENIIVPKKSYKPKTVKKVKSIKKASMKKLFNIPPSPSPSPSPSPLSPAPPFKIKPIEKYKQTKVEKNNNINMKDILNGIEQPNIKPKQVKSNRDINLSKLKCNEIHKAKLCKSNIKCMFDYNDYKCKDKNNDVNIINKPMPHMIQKTPKSHKSKKSNKVQKASNKSLKQTTSDVFKQLITSFQRIGNEAKKDAIILKKATNKL
jgi:thiol-disulfide isomerase/thioredoxin